jgi:hypothetical protein
MINKIYLYKTCAQKSNPTTAVFKKGDMGGGIKKIILGSGG